jgi:spore coat protein U-like protein
MMDGGWRAAHRLMPGLMLMAASAVHGANCSVSTSDLNFGSYDPVSSNATAPSDSATTLTVDCQGTLIALQETITVSIALSSGSGAGAGSYNPRQMQDIFSGDKLNYNLYWDAARTQIAGNGTAGTSKLSRSAQVPCVLLFLLCGSTTFRPTVYGRIFAAQDVGVGDYRLPVPITVTVSF